MSDARTMLITGGASGLGLALAQQAAALGWRVAIADINETRGDAAAKEIAGSGGDAMFVRCDVRDEASIRIAMQRIARRWGQLDALINNAGIATTGLFETLTDEDWQQQLNTDLLGTVRSCRAAVSEMQRHDHGRIINIAGLHGAAPLPGLSSFSATQAAIIALSESLRAELAPLGIQVSVALPSFFRSNLNETLRSADPVSRARFLSNMGRQTSSSEYLAKLIMAAMDKNDFLIMPPEERWLLRQKRWQPKRYFAKLLALAEKFRR
ncbi:MAG: SDR family NAD(P)-dependent oxidoreductase [Alcanivoracaceae bacterium]|nr:SDR family NAD(P)-dependent oxidoreductase [Alcanivoracaceae bacterium]